MQTDVSLTNIPATELGVFQAVEQIEAANMEIIGKVASINEVSRSIKIKSDEDEKLAIDSIGAIVQTDKSIEETRKHLISIPQLFIKMVNGKFKPLTESLDNSKSRINQLLSSYQHNKRMEAQRAQEKAQAYLDKTRARLEKKGYDTSILSEKAPEIVTESTVRAESATSYTKKVTEFIIEDFMALVKSVAEGKEKPEALLVNESYIRGLIKAGVREIPGVKVYETDQMVVRCR